MTAAHIKIPTIGDRDGYIIAVIPPEDAYHTGTLLVVGRVYRISADGEPQEWKAWLFPVAGGWAHVSDSCEAIEGKSPEQLRDQLQKRVGRQGAWWKVTGLAAEAAPEVTVTVAKVPDPTGTGKVRVEATWPPGDHGDWLVRMQGEDFADGARLIGTPRWSWTGFLSAGRYSLNVEGFEPAPFEVTP